ncbi:MAG: histidinol-phosphate transaminase [Chloroflexota bacterium]
MIEPKESVKNTPPTHHGAFDYDELAQLGYSPDEVLDFSVNSNPYGAPPSVREAIASVPLDRYPDRECIALREKLAEHHNTNIENIVVGNGTAELLMLIGQAFIREGDKVVAFSHTFSEYERVARLFGAELCIVPQTVANGLSAVISEHRKIITNARIVFECHPDNPSGLINHGDHQTISIEANPDTLFVYDQAYINFLPKDFHYSKSPITPITDNVLYVRSLTKDYALAGLRLGYAIGHPDIIEAIRRVRPAWNVNALAQSAGLTVLDEGDWLKSCVQQLHQDKEKLVAGIEKLGLPVMPSYVHYFLVNVGDATAFRSELLKHKIMVRDCTSFGLPEYVRIATRTPEDNAKLLQAIEAIQS